MAKFPTEAECSVTISAPIERVYAYMWDVAASSSCIAGLESCQATGEADTYCFTYEPRSTGPVTMVVRYTAAYSGNGRDEIRFKSCDAAGDNTDVDGLISMVSKGDNQTELSLRQMLAPDTPVPRLVQGLIRSFVESEAAQGVENYLAEVKKALEAA